eukprot:gene5842-6540_t
MFCHKCGSRLDNETQNFCGSCGVKLSTIETPSEPGSSAVEVNSTPRLSFTEYKRKMESQRATFYRPEAKKKKTANKVEMEVNVNVGLMELNDNDRRLKPVRGTMTPLRVKKSIRRKEMLEKAVRKHQAHNGLGYGPYELLYPNQIQVKNLLEKEEQEFVLEKYKEEVGKPYNRLNFYLVPITDFLKSLSLPTHSDDDDDVNINDGMLHGADASPVNEYNIRALNHMEDIVPFEVPDTIITSPATGSSCTVTNHMEDIDIHPVEMSHNAGGSVDIGPSSSNFMQSSSLPGMSNVSDRFVAGLSSSSTISVPEVIPAGTAYASFEFCNDYPSDDGDDATASTEMIQSDDVTAVEDFLSSVGLKESLLGLAASNIKTEEFERVKVRRAYVWNDAKVKLGKMNIKAWSKSLKVQFVGESAVDDGGPKREMTSLVHTMVCKSNMFQGNPDARCFSNNFTALKDGDYRLYGQFCAWTILQGCPAPSFFAPPVVDYILFGAIDKVSCNFEYIPQSFPEIHAFVKSLQNAETEAAFQEICDENINTVFDAGITKPRLSLEDKENIIESLSWKTVIGDSMLPLLEFLDGLSLHGFLQMVRKHPEDARYLFQGISKAPLTADYVDDLFLPQLSVSGSNRRNLEEELLMNFTHFLEDLEGDVITAELLCPEDDSLSKIVLHLDDFLQFVTGSPKVPCLGFSTTPSIIFNHVDTQRKISVSTCALQLCIPVNTSLLAYESFKADFRDCIVSSPGFGQV